MKLHFKVEMIEHLLKSELKAMRNTCLYQSFPLKEISKVNVTENSALVQLDLIIMSTFVVCCPSRVLGMLANDFS